MNPPPQPAPEPGPAVVKRQTLWLLLALFFVEGWFGFIVGEKSDYYPTFQLFCTLANTIFIVRWLVTDAAQRRFRLSKTWIFCFVLFTPIAIIFYFIKSRGAGAWRPIALAFVALLVFGIALQTGKSAAGWLL